MRKVVVPKRVTPNDRLQRTVMDKVPRHERQRAAAEPGRYATLESAVANSKQSAHLDHLTIFVRNADHSRDWYTSTLGLKVEFEVPSPRAVALQDSGGFGLFVEQRPAPECKPSCVVTFRVEDVDALAQALQTKGVALSAAPQKLFWGYGAELRDPDGYLVRLWDEHSMKEKGG